MLLPLMDKYGPTINWNLTGSLPSAMNFSRMGNATYVDENGYVTWAPANMLPNGDFTGAVKPSRFPDGWVSVATQDGITVTVEDTGYEDGTPYVDIRYTGTAGNTSGSLHVFAANNSFPASLGQSYTMSLHARRVGGSLAGVASVNIASREYANSTGLGASFENTVLALTTTKTRFHRTYECVEPTITQIRWGSRVVANLGETIDVTIRYYQGMMERTSYNSPRPYIPTRGSAYYGPRFDHDPVTGRPIGLLYEPQRTKRVLYSNGGSWAKINTAIALAGAASPDGASNAFIVTDDGANTYHTVSSNEGSQYVTGSIYSSSIYLKAGTQNVVQLTFSSGVVVGNPYANFDLFSGTVASFGGANASITPIGNGWFRCGLSAVAGSSTYSVSLILSGTNNNMAATRAPAYQGTGLTYQAFGAQGEVGGTITSLLPTSGGQATRAADLLMLDIPDGISSLRYTFDDNSTQDVVVSPGSYTVPTNLNRPNIKRVVSV